MIASASDFFQGKIAQKAPDSYHLSRRPANNHKLARVLARRGQRVIEKPQNGSVMVRDIRSQYVNQYSHARLRQSKNTPQQREK